MENFIIATIILSIILIFVSVNSVIICNVCDEITALIDEGKLEEACALWEKKKGYVSIFVRDAEVDCVNSEVGSFGGEYSLEDGEAKLKAMSLREAVNELKHSEVPIFDNIF